MSGLDSIPVKVEGLGGADQRTQNLDPILQQLSQCLTELRDDGNESVIDLGAMPFSAQDESDLRARLGKGEVSAVVEVFGITRVEETGVPGIWFVEHRDAEDRRLTLQLEITRIPALLVTPIEDLDDGLERLAAGDPGGVDAPM